MGREKGKTGQRTDVWWYTSWAGCTDLHPRSSVDEVLALAVLRVGLDVVSRGVVPVTWEVADVVLKKICTHARRKLVMRLSCSGKVVQRGVPLWSRARAVSARPP